jgi:dipeptidyl-peptidase-4
MKTIKKSLGWRNHRVCFFVSTLLALPVTASSASAQNPQNPGKNSQNPPSSLTIDRIGAEPDRRPIPASLRWSPDKKHLAWAQPIPHSAPPASRIASLEPVQEIWTLEVNPDANPGAQPRLLVPAGKIIQALRGSTQPPPPKINDDDDSNPWFLRSFAWSPESKSIYLYGNTAIARLDLNTGAAQLLLSGKDPLTDAALSPDGHFISFIRNHSLWLLPTTGGEPRAFALSPASGILEGEPDWSYRNLFHVEQSYAWSPDSSRIAWLETDDRAVATRSIESNPIESGNGETHTGEVRTIAWPSPGGAIPKVRLLVQAVAGGKPVEMKLIIPAGAAANPQSGWEPELAAQSYLPRFEWLPDSRHIAIERLARSQQQLDLYRAETTTGTSRILLTEKDDYWINLADNLRFLADGSFLWTSERSGFRHLYRYSAAGKQIAQLTSGNWEITSLDGISESGGKGEVYFTATKASPLERHLYAVSLSTSGSDSIRQITQMAGTHAVSFAPDGSRFADIYSNRNTQPRLAILETEAAADEQSKLASLLVSFPGEKPLPELEDVELAPFTLHMGQQTASLLIKPKNFDPQKKYPVILYLAGGPGEQLARDAWDGARGLWMRSMAEQGYAIFAIDNQGTAGRGHRFEEPVHLRLGAQEMVDQRDAVNYLRVQPWVDGQRIGVCGWGYGGTLAVHAMLDRPVTYKAGFAGAPMVDWREGNAIFAERYLEDIKLRFHSWESSAAVNADSGKFFKGKLMVAQGTEDEWVPLDQLFMLQGAMVDRGKSIETLLLPGRGHTVDDLPARKLVFSRMTEFFLKNL